MRPTSLRTHMMVSFCVGFGVLLAFSYILFFFFLKGEVIAQINRQLLQTTRPIIASLIHTPNGDDVDRLDIPNEYFELLGPTGNVLQRSKNLTTPLNLAGTNLFAPEPTFCLVKDANGFPVRGAIIPFMQAGQRRIMVVGQPRGTLNVLDIFGQGTLLLFPISLLLSALIATWYVSKGLAPITTLTEQAAQMAKRVTKGEEFWTPLAVVSPPVMKWAVWRRRLISFCRALIQPCTSCANL